MIYSSMGPMIYSTLATDYIKMTHQIIYISYLCKVAADDRYQESTDCYH